MPEIIPINANVHFKCAFDMSSESCDTLMTYLRQKFRSWCIDRVGINDPVFHQSWFYLGNPKTEPQCVVNGYQIRTAMAAHEDVEEPNAWAMELIHTDTTERARKWSIEIALRKNNDGSVRFTTINKHWMIPYFIGEYPDPPSPSVPRYVRYLLSDSSLKCYRGDSVLNQHWQKVSTTDTRKVFDSLISEERQAPFIFMAANSVTEHAMIAPQKIINYVKGNANVFYLSSSSVLDEMNYYLGENLRCEDGMIRIFIPGLRIGDGCNARLHRFITKNEIEKAGESAILRYITNGISRNGKILRLNDFTSIQHIFAERRKNYLAQHIANRKELVSESQAVWEDNQELENEVQKLANEATEWESMALQYESENQKLQQEVGSLTYRVEEAEQLRKRFIDLELLETGIKTLTSLPTSINEVLDSIKKLFPNRIEISQQAISSAEDYMEEFGNGWGKPGPIAIAWSMTFDLVTTLYDLVFLDHVNNLENSFNARSSYDLAMTEGKLTKKDKQLMKLREIQHEGKTINITPHLKYGNKVPKLLRLHFSIESEEKKFIIGHFGNHLTNASTRKKIG